MPRSMFIILISIVVEISHVVITYVSKMIFIVHGCIKGGKHFSLLTHVDMRGYDFYHGQNCFSHLS